jgi:hypothetical protein
VFNRGGDPTKMKKRQREHEITNVPESNEVKMYKKKQELLKKTARMATEETGVKVVNEQFTVAA